MNRIGVLLVFSVNLLGCGVSGVLPDVNNPSAVAYIDELVVRTTARNLDKLFDTTSDGVTDGYRWYKGWWCPRHEAVGSAIDVKREVSAHCAANGGAYDMNSFCRDRGDADKVLFVARISPTGECSSGTTVTVEVAESLHGDMNPSYVSMLRSFGYETRVDISARVADQAQRQEALEFAAMEDRDGQEANREAAAAKILSSPQGSRVCKQGQIIYSVRSGPGGQRHQNGRLVAQLDALSDDRSQLRFRVIGVDIPRQSAAEKEFGGGYRMGEYALSPGSVYWDTLAGWEVCGQG